MDKARIFYFCYDHQQPTGGQKSMYKHVDILNRNGLEAYVFHREEGFSLSWFEHDTRIVSLNEFNRIYHPERDVLVVPEDLGATINDLPGHKVILNQNAYYGFGSFDFNKPEPYPYLNPEVRSVIVVSDHNREYLHLAYPDMNLHRVYYSIDPDLFCFQEIARKEKKIACLPAKNTMDLLQLYHITLSRADQGLNRLKEFEWVFIQDKSEQEVAETLGQSLIFIFLSTSEGFGIIPVEAMSSDCMVLAYNHGPPTEYLRPDNSFPIGPCDISSLVANLEHITKVFLEQPEELEAVSLGARDMARRYSSQREENSLMETWHQILAGC